MGGRLGRRLPASGNFNSSPFFHLDRLSGQTFAQAFDAVAQLLRTGVPAANVPTQPWFQNNLPGGPGRVLIGNEANFINGSVSNIFQTIDLARLSGGLKPFNNLQTQTAFVRTSLGRSNYNVMILRKQPAAGLSVDFNYTFSKSLDQSSALQNSTNTLQNAFFPDFDYGPSDLAPDNLKKPSVMFTTLEQWRNWFNRRCYLKQENDPCMAFEWKNSDQQQAPYAVATVRYVLNKRASESHSRHR